MSGIAEVLVNLGYNISGSDIQRSETTKRLQKLGAHVVIGHAAENIGNADVVVTSTAVKTNNPEVMEAHRRSIPVIPRAEMLAELLKMKFSVAISGSHANYDDLNDFYDPGTRWPGSDNGYRRKTGRHRQQCPIRRWRGYCGGSG